MEGELEREGREGECVVTVCTCNVTLCMYVGRFQNPSTSSIRTESEQA